MKGDRFEQALAAWVKEGREQIESLSASAGCPPFARLAEIAVGDPPPRQAEQDHVERCTRCAALLRGLNRPRDEESRPKDITSLHIPAPVAEDALQRLKSRTRRLS